MTFLLYSGKLVITIDSSEELYNVINNPSISTEEKSDFVFFDALSFSDKGNNYNIPQRYVRKRKYEKSGGGSRNL